MLSVPKSAGSAAWTVELDVHWGESMDESYWNLLLDSL